MCPARRSEPRPAAPSRTPSRSLSPREGWQLEEDTKGLCPSTALHPEGRALWGAWGAVPPSETGKLRGRLGGGQSRARASHQPAFRPGIGPGGPPGSPLLWGCQAPAGGLASFQKSLQGLLHLPRDDGWGAQPPAGAKGGRWELGALGASVCLGPGRLRGRLRCRLAVWLRAGRLPSWVSVSSPSTI